MSGDKEALPVRTLLQQIQAKVIAPASLDAETRRDVVELLTAEGYAQSAIAQILACSDRTIRRDVQAIRDRNALAPHPSLVAQFVGELVAVAHRHGDTLTRLAREATASVGERGQAAYLAWKVQVELIQRLQSLGYLPEAPTTIVMDGTAPGHGGIPSFHALGEELRRIETRAAESGMDSPEAHLTRQRLLVEVERGQLAEEIDQTQYLSREEGLDDETPATES